MNIGVDTRHLAMMSGTGGAQVMYHGLSALRKFDTANRYLPFADGLGAWGAQHPRLAPLAAAYADIIHKNTFLPLWARYQRLDLLLYYLPPCSWTIRKVPQICYILDVPEPQEVYAGRDWVYNQVFIRQSARVADHIITISKFSKEQICSGYRLNPDKISVVTPCLDLDFFSPAPNTASLRAKLKQKGVEPGFYFGLVSKLAPRKNPGGYLEIFSRLPPKLRKERKLVIAGAPGTLADFKPFAADSLLDAIRDDVVILGRIAYEDLPGLYSLAAALLFPSLYEGFGLPVAEAAACGTDVVASSIPAVKEAASPAAFLFGPTDYDAMAGCLQSLSPPADRRSVHLAWANKFGYPRYAEQMKEVYRRATG